MGSCMCKNRMVRPVKVKALPVSPLNASKLLQFLFTDLSGRSRSGQSIDKATFHEFCGLQAKHFGLEERLFAYFDREKTGELSFGAFAHGIRGFVFSPPAEKLRVVFCVFDVNVDDRLDYAELTVLVASTWHVFQNVPVFRGKLQSDLEAILNMTQEQTEVHFVVKHLIDKYGENQTLSFNDFLELASEIPSFLDLFNQVFKEQLWRHNQTSEAVYYEDNNALVKINAIFLCNVLVLEEAGNLILAFCTAGHTLQVKHKKDLVGVSFTSTQRSVALWFDDSYQLHKWKKLLAIEEITDDLPETKLSSVYS